jgi:hypothetical protein
MTLTRDEELREIFFPVLLNYHEWKEHPEEFAYGTDMDRVLLEYKKGMKVTSEEWVKLEKEFADKDS